MQFATPTSARRTLPWCDDSASPSSSSPLLAIGITSTAERRHMRDAQRATWLSRLTHDLSDVKAHFIMRGVGLDGRARSAALDEAAAHSDILFVRASANLSRATGPLHSVFLWFRCAATTLYPQTPFIGKAEDDVWINTDGVAALLRTQVMPWVGKPYEAYVGAVATYHWDTRVDGGPIGYREIPSALNCAAPNKSMTTTKAMLVGPFNFVKGPLVVLSARLVALVSSSHSTKVASAPDEAKKEKKAEEEDDDVDARCLPGSSWFWHPSLTAAAEKTVPQPEEEREREVCGGKNHAPTDTNSSSGSSSSKSRWGTVAWDDVWLGYALSSLRRTGRVAVVGFGDELFDDTWGFAAKQTALYWHARVDNDVERRMAGLHGWMHRANGCTDVMRTRSPEALPAAFRLTCHAPKLKDGATLESCARQPWLLCRARSGLLAVSSNCTASKIDLWGQPHPLTGKPILAEGATKLVRVRGVWKRVPSS